jgi:hypothetical protein
MGHLGQGVDVVVAIEYRKRAAAVQIKTVARVEFGVTVSKMAKRRWRTQPWGETCRGDVCCG